MKNYSLSNSLDTVNYDQISNHTDTFHIFENFSIKNNSSQFIQPYTVLMAFYVTYFLLLFIAFIAGKMFKRNLPVIPLSNMIFTISSRSTQRPSTGVEECQIEMETYHNTNSRVINVQPKESNY